MTARLAKNAFGEEDLRVPTKDDNSRYRYEMICQGESTRAYADTITDLLAVLIPGYADLDEAGQARARVQYAADTLAPLQAVVLSRFDRRTIPAEDLDVLTRPRHEPVVVEEWASTVPLVVMDVDYAPYTEIPAPMSATDHSVNPENLIWLRAGEDEDTFMVSLANAGIVTLNEALDYRL